MPLDWTYLVALPWDATLSEGNNEYTVQIIVATFSDMQQRRVNEIIYCPKDVPVVRRHGTALNLNKSGIATTIDRKSLFTATERIRSGRIENPQY